MGRRLLIFGTYLVMSSSFRKTLKFGTEDSKKTPPFVPLRDFDIMSNKRSASFDGSAVRLNSSRAFALNGMPE